MRHVNGKAGETRSVLRREYLLHTPDAFVSTPMPCAVKGLTIVHASPRLGAGFLQYTAELEAGGELLPVPEQRFFWVLDGEVSVDLQAKPKAGFSAALRDDKHGQSILGTREYGYLPSAFPGAIKAQTTARLAVIEKRYEALEGFAEPKAFTGREADTTPIPLGGDPDLLVRSLLPGEFGFDFAVNTMEYSAGAALAQVEVHVMEHGLLMLEGEGTYLLGADRYFVEGGDFIWMAPYCPQWFVAEGGKPAKYLIYKDWNRRPRL
jgi:(S)-ureidoglycine aminohydrolase